MSPISSRKIVPPSAWENLPTWREVAPVNEPFSWPKSSDSISSSGMAAQFTLTNDSPARALRRWISQAISSFPVPLSPTISTVALVGAARATDSITAFIAGASPIRVYFPSTWCRSATFSSRRRFFSMAFRSAVSTRSDSSGFSMKS